MALYLLSRSNNIGYDEFDAKVIRANTESHAREIANSNTGCEGKICADTKLVDCVYLDPTAHSGTILESFNED